MLWKFVVSIFLLIAVFEPSNICSQSTRWAEIHAKDDAEWSAKSGLPIDEVQQLRKLTGISDESPDLIANIDTSLLKRYNTVLFATYGGSGKCVTFWVFSRERGGFKETWSTADAGDQAVFCADPKCSLPLVKGQSNRSIIVEIPSYYQNRCVVRSLAVFRWTGSGYIYQGLKKPAHKSTKSKAGTPGQK